MSLTSAWPAACPQLTLVTKGLGVFSPPSKAESLLFQFHLVNFCPCIEFI